MGFYADWLAPRLCDFAMRNARLAPYRRRVVTAAEGRVLEIGIGSGLNLSLYGANVERVFGLDPSPVLIEKAAQAGKRAGARVELLRASAERIPLESRSIDTIVMTWVGCSIPDVETALAEMRRVLKPGGSMLFVEHGRSPEARVARWQDRLDPVWRRISGGCHMNRQIDISLRRSGFRIERLETGYMPGPKLLTFLYEGRAAAN
ncbi:MAG TPA: class I SAM-dependent methyltransferase [Xanthobacteraceae bacterium]|jgi:ubiquinone/menaquinone biosynthesis C-methylase UbiE|nr:class I SAM-dependent methyltransferase [Xanthobacteraceae bacterium]